MNETRKLILWVKDELTRIDKELSRAHSTIKDLETAQTHLHTILTSLHPCSHCGGRGYWTMGNAPGILGSRPCLHCRGEGIEPNSVDGTESGKITGSEGGFTPP